MDVLVMYGNGESVILPHIMIKASATTEVDVSAYLSESQKTQEPIAIMPNSGNHGYCRVVLDSESVKYLIGNLTKVNSFDRCYLYRVLYDHVFMEKMGGNDYVKMITDMLASED